MSEKPTIELDALMVPNPGSVDPSRFPDETFDLYSVAAFDNGRPEISLGREIGSSKQVVQSNDVLLSRIVPHIRRAWVVGEQRGYRQIASGEWIVFRSAKSHPSYLRYLLVEDRFHTKFMKTVAGVGGSLLRARPTQVADIEVPLPSLSEQKRIAGHLEQADRLVRTRRYALELTDTLLPAAFLEIFGDPEKNPFDWSQSELGELCDEVLDCPHSTPIYAPLQTPHPCVRSSDIQNGYLDFSEAKYVSACEYETRIARGKPMPGDVIYCREGARFGNAARIIDTTEMCLGQRTMLFRANSKVAVGEFIWGFLSSRAAYRQAMRALDGSASPHVNVGDIVAFRVPLPPLSLQQRFASMCQRVDHLRTVQREALRQAEHLFASLLDRAFSADREPISAAQVEVPAGRSAQGTAYCDSAL